MTKEIDAAAEAMKEQISKMMQSFKLPDVDMTALVEGQRKNIDAMAKVAQLTTDRATAISQRHQLIVPTIDGRNSARCRWRASSSRASRRQTGRAATKLG